MSMRLKAALIIVLIVFVVNMTNFLSNLFFTNKSINETMEQDLALALDIADGLLSTKMELIKSNGATIAERLLKAPSSRKMIEIMASEITKFPEFTALSVFDKEHGVIASYGVPIKPAELFAEDRYVQMAYNGKRVISTTLYDTETNDLIMHVFVPMTSDMVLAATIPGLTFSSYISDYRLWRNGSIGLLDEEGTTIANYDTELVLRRLSSIRDAKANPDVSDKEIQSRINFQRQLLSSERGTVTFFFNGIEVLCTYKRVTWTTAGWHVFVMAPINENPGFNLRLDLLFSSLFFMALGAIASIFISGLVTRPFYKIQEQADKIQEANKRTNLLLNAMPLTCHLWDSNYKMFYCNEENSRLFNQVNAQEFLNTFSDYSPKYQADGQLSTDKRIMCLKKVFEEGGEHIFDWTHQLKDGTLIPSEITLVRVVFDDEYVIAAYVRDLREQKRMIKEIEQRDNLLDTINAAAVILLKSDADEFERDMQFCVGMIADAIDLDRIYIWKNHKKDDKLYCTQIFEWSGGAEPQQNTEYTVDISYTDAIPGWETILSSGNCINGIVREMSAKEQTQLSPRGALSVFIVPVFLRDEFWGYIGYDDCHRERLLTENEQSILRSGGLVITNVLLRNEMMKNIQSAAAKLEAVVANFPGIIWSADQNNVFTLYNGQYLEKIGVESSSVIGLKLDDYFSRHYSKDEYERVIRNIKSTYINGPQDWITKIDDQRFRNRTTPIFDNSGGVIGVVGSFDDITELSRLQTELQVALMEAREANKAKSDFLTNISHEMRTPLNAIIGLSGLSLDADGINEEIHSNLERIYEAGETLLYTVNDILDISKIEAGKLELIPDEYEIPSLINDTITQNILRIGEKPIKFILDIDASMPAYLFGDELRVKQIFNNLLSNAFKYTREGRVTLSVRCEQEDETVWMIIRVEDTGIGIKSEDMKNLFTDYFQMNTKTNHEIEGTGLGLSITKKLAETMEGSVTAESKYGKGSVFTAKIKQKFVNYSTIGEDVAKNLKSFRYSDQKRRKNSMFVRKQMPYARVLVVDDVTVNLDVVKGILSPYGMQIDCVTSGREAVEIIRNEKHRYDAVFMDHMMPEMDGIETTRIIREEIGTEYARTVPIIALTANAIIGNEKMFLEKGFQAFISKPINVMHLDKVLDIWIRSKQSGETLLQAEEKTVLLNTGTEAQNSLNVLKDVFLEGVDFTQAMELYNNETAYLNMLRSYLLHTSIMLEKIRSPLQKDLHEYAVTVHGLKGSSYGICANAIGDEAGKLEITAREGDFDQVIARNGSFITMVESLLTELGELLQKISASAGKKQAAAFPDSMLLYRLLKAARLYQAATMEQIIRELESYEYATGGELVALLRKKMDNLEYNAICEQLEHLSDSIL